MNKNKYYKQIDGNWIHRSPIKVMLNPLLRKLQWYTSKPYVIASVTEWSDVGQPAFIRYTFTRVKLETISK